MDGAPQFLRAARALFDHRDFRGPGTGAAVDKGKVEAWRKRLTADGTLDENLSLDWSPTSACR